MADPLRKVHTGDELQISASAWNSLIDLVRPSQGNTAAGTPTTGREAVIIRVRNDSGEDLDRYSIVGLDGPIFSPSDSSDTFLRQPAFSGTTPSIAIHKRKYAVLLDPAKSGLFARAFLAGVCQVRVDLRDPSHGFAGIKHNTTAYLESSRYGHAQILWTEADSGSYGYDTGEMWAIVRLGVTMSCFAVGIAVTDITARDGALGTFGSGQVALYYASIDGSAGISSALETITVLNPSSDVTPYGAGIDAGTWVSVAWDADGNAFVAPLECPSAY